MSEKPISRYPVPNLDELPDDLRDRILAVQEKAGFVPNVFLALAHRPDECRAFFDYHDALMLRERGLSKAEREMIVVSTSGENNCQYCVVAHGAILRIYAKDPLLADQVAINFRKADITARQRAMLVFAEKVAVNSAALEESDYETLREHGFDDEDIWDIGAIAAFFALSNRMANLTAMRPNDEFYLMGRLPRESST
ncbi:MAG: alkylhydroperoxidase [Acidiferrobacteraceae bacterium]|nr:alkylhydroperoxidase [Acidiferrobacteraceae bacterium]MDP6398544.1 peroxidase-related enzyme [Arenicellales bacterium]MDP6552781.1 peroxidase-related enzyme [Arenicellales bacterium]MDP6791125.1 peroxidase-related enzyme [Arenicellales bacterium]MDP6918875.1 peroxidase-related enzyme [Arenicellales bacterium]